MSCALNLPLNITLFDLDHTLIPIDSDYAWGVFTTALGWNNPDEFTRQNDAFYAQYKAGTLDIHAYVRFATAALCRKGALQSEAANARFMHDVIQTAIQPQAMSLIRAHQQAGDAVVIVTATNEFLTRPIATALGVSDLIAINLACDANTGWFNGEISGIPSFREGKVTRIQDWLSERHLSWADVETTFYSDSINDLPLLERVNHPVATNPDASLRTIALHRGWRLLDLFHDLQVSPIATQ